MQSHIDILLKDFFKLFCINFRISNALVHAHYSNKLFKVAVLVHAHYSNNYKLFKVAVYFYLLLLSLLLFLLLS